MCFQKKQIGCDGAMVIMLAFNSKGHEFDYWQLHFAKLKKILREKLKSQIGLSVLTSLTGLDRLFNNFNFSIEPD